MTAAEPLQIGQHQGLSDEEVVGRVRAGDVALYEILMRRHNQRLYRAVRAILRDESEVEDILQEAYLAAYRNLSEFQGRARFSTWLVRIAVNRALDLRRKRAKVIALNPKAEDGIANSIAETTSASSREDPEQHSARLELTRLLEHAIDALPRPFRGVYVLRDIDGMSTQETAESLGLEVNTVKTRLHRARSLLRERLRSRRFLSARDAATGSSRWCWIASPEVHDETRHDRSKERRREVHADQPQRSVTHF